MGGILWIWNRWKLKGMVNHDSVVFPINILFDNCSITDSVIP